jgi:hypothetical protein
MSSGKQTKQSNPKKYTKLICSPSIKAPDETCYTSETLRKMKTYWNARHPDKLINSNDATEIWSELKSNMDSVCSTEKCWLRQKFMKSKVTDELINYTFAPSAPISWKKNPDEWLNSVDIEDVMKQYERKVPTFMFIGPSPIDFDKHLLYGECVWDELCKFKLENILKKGKNKIGIIFNLDPHYKGGSHWISMFIDIRKKFIFFFDSTGDKPPKQIKALISRILEESKYLNLGLTYHENSKEHQKGDNECGIYSLYCLIQLMHGEKTVEDFMTGKITDDDMHQLRSQYFNIENDSSG